MKIVKFWIDGNRIYAQSDSGEVYSQPILRYPRLAHASDEERTKYRLSTSGIHWRDIDEDISYSSFMWADNDPNVLVARRLS